jgi:succinate dehydrogenase assembly factor 2
MKSSSWRWYCACKRGEETEVKRARLLYQSRKRGILENELLLSSFASKHLDSLGEEGLEMYDRLLNDVSNDWDLYYWMVGRKEPPASLDNEVMGLLKDHAKNVKKESRLRQPNLS